LLVLVAVIGAAGVFDAAATDPHSAPVRWVPKMING
jgi:hypothetical protein